MGVLCDASLLPPWSVRRSSSCLREFKGHKAVCPCFISMLCRSWSAVQYRLCAGARSSRNGGQRSVRETSLNSVQVNWSPRPKSRWPAFRFQGGGTISGGVMPISDITSQLQGLALACGGRHHEDRSRRGRHFNGCRQNGASESCSSIDLPGLPRCSLTRGLEGCGVGWFLGR